MPKIGQHFITEIETWIRQGYCKGKPAEFLVMRAHDGLEVRRSAKGMKYSCFGLHQEEDGWHVTHVPTGRQCGVALSHREAAERLIFCLRRMNNWGKVKWTAEKENGLGLDLQTSCMEASEYCLGVEQSYETLLDTIRYSLPEEDESPDLDPEPVEAQPLNFDDDGDYI